MSVNKTTDVTERGTGKGEGEERLCQTLLHYLPFAEIETNPAPKHL